MKKSLFLAALLCIMSLTISAKGKQPVAFENVPQPVQTEFQKLFTADQIQYITVEKVFRQRIYAFNLSDGTKISYNHKGLLRNVENWAGVNLQLIPEKILEYAQKTFPKATITEYTVDNAHLELELNDNMELIFSKRYKFLRIED